MRLPRIAATLTFACVFSAGVTAPRATAASQASSSSSSSKSAAHKKKHRSRQQPKQKAPTADRITEIQSALSREGYYQGEPNGKWDGKTVAAVEKFQSANGIQADGKLDAPTLQRLGLGSDIAGVSAPKPVAPPSCCSMMAPSAAPSNQPAAPASTSAIAENSPVSSGSPKPAEH